MEGKILKIFGRNTGAYVSGEEISKELDVSRTTVWKHIEALRDIGYDIEASPHLGYKLVSRPDRLIPEELKDNLTTGFIGSTVVSYGSIESTNDAAYKFAERGLEEGVVVVSEKQSRGKGRQGRSWVSPEGGIYLSCVLRPEIEPREVAKMTLVAAVAACISMREVTGVPAMIKWPNDIIIREKKVCGILTEMKAEQDKVDFLVVGIGVNVYTPLKLLPKGATSIARESKSGISKVAVAKRILESLEHYVILFRNEGFGSIRDEWRDLSATVGHRVKVYFQDEKVEGQAVDVDEDGALVVRLDSGIQKRILSGDVLLAH